MSPRPPVAPFALVAAIVLATYLPAALARTAWKRDEIRLVEVSRQMAEYDHPLVPHINGEVYREKPPLLNWMVQAAHLIVGDWFVAAHLVVVLFVALGAVATCGIAASIGLLRDPVPLCLAGLFFATSVGVAERAVTVVFDPALTGFVLLCVWCWLVHARATGRRRRLAWLGSVLALSAAALTKGPVALLHAAVAMAAAHTAVAPLRVRDLASVVAVVVLAALAPVAWVLAAAQDVGWWFWDYMVVHQTASRIAGEAAPHALPVYAYLTALPPALLPAFALVPGAVALSRNEPRGAASRRALRALALWILPLLLVFSVISGKRIGYVLPMLAPACMFAAFGVEAARGAAAGAPGRRLVGGALVLLALLFALFGVALVATALVPGDEVAARAAPVLKAPPAVWTTELRIVAAVLGVLLVPLGVLGFRATRAGRPARAAGLVVAATCLVLAIGGHALTHALEPFNSPRIFVEEAARRVPRGETVYAYPSDLQGRFTLFAQVERRPVLTDELLATLEESRTPFWVLADGKAWDRSFARGLGHVVYARIVRDRPMMLVRVEWP